MTLEESIIAKFASIFTGRLWFDVIPPSFSTPAQLSSPFCIVQQVSDVQRVYVDNTAHDFLQVRMQFSIWGARAIDVRASSDALRAAALASNTAVWIMQPESGSGTDYNEVLALRGMRQDFTIWFPDPIAVP